MAPCFEHIEDCEPRLLLISSTWECLNQTDYSENRYLNYSCELSPNGKYMYDENDEYFTDGNSYFGFDSPSVITSCFMGVSARRDSVKILFSGRQR